MRATYHGLAAAIGKTGAILAAVWFSYIADSRKCVPSYESRTATEHCALLQLVLSFLANKCGCMGRGMEAHCSAGLMCSSLTLVRVVVVRVVAVVCCARGWCATA